MMTVWSRIVGVDQADSRCFGQGPDRALVDQRWECARGEGK